MDRHEMTFAAVAPILARVGADTGHLGLADVWALRSVSRATHRAMRAYDERVEFPFLERVFRDTPPDVARDVLDAMRTRGAVIAGSAVLARITEATVDARWTAKDVDVFVRAVDRNGTLVPPRVFVRARYDSEDTTYAGYGDYSELDICVAKFVFDDTCVDVVCPCSLDPHDYVRTKFDISACAASLHWSHELERVVFRAPSARHVLERRARINYDEANPRAIVTRYDKYVARGYTFDNTSMVEELRRTQERNAVITSIQKHQEIALRYLHNVHVSCPTETGEKRKRRYKMYVDTMEQVRKIRRQL